MLNVLNLKTIDTILHGYQNSPGYSFRISPALLLVFPLAKRCRGEATGEPGWAIYMTGS